MQFKPGRYVRLTGQERWAFQFAHAPSVRRTLLEIEKLEPSWHLENAPYPPRYGRYSADEPIFGWSIPRNTAFYLYSLVTATKSVRALEIGTSFAYSTIWLGSALSRTGGRITTCEIFERKIEIARRFIKRSGLRNITLIPGDATAFMRRQSGKFDFVLLDADATEYASYLPWLRQHVSIKGLLAMDNALSHADVTSDFVSQLQKDRAWTVWLWPYDHGLVLARKVSPARRR
jgi:predicted O-methyltransferase YrrM